MNTWVNCKIFGFSEAALRPEAASTEWIASKAVLKKTRSRIHVLLCVFLFAYALVLGRMTHLTLARAVAPANDELSQKIMASTVNAKRADIYDREGRLLATSLKMSSLYADPKNIYDPAEAARKLMTVFPDLTYDDTFKKLKDKHKRFVWLKRNLTPKQIYAANSLGIPGIDFLDETRRMYPQGNLTAHVLGYTDIDHKGLSGLERGMNDLLGQSDAPLQTSLDVRLQHILYKELKGAIADFTAIGGAGLIMDANNGEIYAMVSLPDYNPHDPGNSENAKFNRVTLGAYEMGSTFKIFTTAALLEFTHTPLSTRFDATNPLRRGGFTISDFHPERRPLTVPEVFIHSSNIGTALEAEKIGTAQMKDFYKKLGFFDRPQLEIKETTNPLIPNPWRDISTVTASYGHGIAVTPLQLAAATAAMVNGGYRVQPTLIKRPAEYYQNQAKERLVSEETSASMRNLLRVVVTDGTASKANIKGYRVGAKTGTAEKTLGRGYSRNAQIASLVAAFPMDKPRFIVLLMVDEPKPNAHSYGYATAGWVAAPATGNVIKAMAPIVGIYPEADERLMGVKSAMGLLPPQLEGGRLASY